ncbi:putative RNA-directed DNA polymerase from transposon X-element [Exaiptasia diaphana]|nr:putative RNA-directed DNA polymerase from transposon X-element [Exaiptasia diaphana]
MNIEEVWQSFTSILWKGIEKFIPSKISKSRRSAPWITQPVQRLIRKKQRLYNKAKSTQSDRDWSAFKSLRKTVKTKIKAAHDHYVLNLLDNSSCYGSDPNNYKAGKRFSRYIRSKRKDSVNIPPLKRLNPKRASGPDLISCRVLKETASEVAPYLRCIFSASLQSGQLPSDWLNANITLVFKKGKRDDRANYRPVSLTSVICKTLEHILYKAIINHLEKYNILTYCQHGFRQGRSCETQLVTTLEDIALNMDKGIQTDMLILDFSKAFDVVPHQRLLAKLNFYGVRGNILSWISTWLTQRHQRVTINGDFSNPTKVQSGVPQGTVLSPLFFLLFVNDIGQNLSPKTKLRLFADDTAVYRSITTEDDVKTLQNDLNQLFLWDSKWQMKFNLKKLM